MRSVRALSVEVIERGARKGLLVTLELAKYFLPAVVAVRMLEAWGLLEPMSRLVEPLMTYFQLPGEVSLALVMGAVSSPYAGIALLAALGLSAKELTIASTMLIFGHSLIIETAIVNKAGANGWLIAGLRLLSGMAAGLILARLL